MRGENGDGQLGIGTTTNADTFFDVKLPRGTKVASVQGANFTVAVTTAGHVIAWGYNADGQHGNNTTTNSDTPVTTIMPIGSTVLAVGAGHSSTAGIAIVNKIVD